MVSSTGSDVFVLRVGPLSQLFDVKCNVRPGIKLQRVESCEVLVITGILVSNAAN
jgi:hypothetical protein